jgi:protease-4
MTSILIFILSINPFYDANFTSLPIRSISVFSNPAGTGIQPGAEFFFTYHPDITRTAMSLGNLGLGMTKIDGITYYEVSLGFDLPGAFSLGYARQFDITDYDISSHIIGVICRPNQYTSLGYKTTIGERNHMFGGISIRPYKEYITLSFDLEYEGVDSILTYYYGGTIQPVDGIGLSFRANEDFDWNAGLEISWGYIKLAGAYSSLDEKISGGIIISAQSHKTFLPKSKKITRLTLQGSYPELENKIFMGVVPLGTEQGFTKLLSDLRSLEHRNDVIVVLVELKENSLGPAQREELRNILFELKNTDKKIVFYAHDYISILNYELACIADEIILSPGGSVVIPGITMRSVYIKNALEKLGIEADIFAVGKYKSAKEVFQRTDMSDEDKEQSNKFLDDVYYPILDNIANFRNKTRKEIEDIINEIGYFNSDDAKNFGLIDTIMYRLDLDNYLKKKYGKMAIVDFDNLFKDNIVEEAWKKSYPKIAIVIAEGDIVPGKGEPGFFVSGLIGGEKYVEVFEDLSRDKSIKAVVFRINSSGGESFASEEIAYAVKRCAEKKPVIVSIGDIAASGGYHIACFADEIYANNRALTGSIGVLGGNVIYKGLYDKMGISWDYVKRGKHSDAFLGLRHFTEDEMIKYEKEIRWTYDRYINHVAEGRNMPVDLVDSLAQGRIYSGVHASKIKLVDEIGTYLDALATAKELADIKGDVEIVIYPKNLGFSPFNMGLLSLLMHSTREYVIE